MKHQLSGVGEYALFMPKGGQKFRRFKMLAPFQAGKYENSDMEQMP